MTDSLQAERGVFSRVACQCDLAAARATTRALRTFLAEHGLDESEQFSCELCLTEACNNAVQYAAGEAAAHPIVVEVLIHQTSVELRVMDHTTGFELHQKPKKLEPNRERGRGIFIIQSLMDDVRYHCGAGGNILVMRKARTHQQHRPADEAASATLGDARRQLEDCQKTISGMARELCFRSESLAAIFRCCTELGHTRDLAGFANRLLNDLLHLTAADWFILRLLAPGGPRLTVFTASVPEMTGTSLSLGDTASTASGPLEAAELGAARTRREVTFETQRNSAAEEPLPAKGPHAGGIVQPLVSGDTLLGTLAIGRHEDGEGFSPLQAEMIRTFSEFIAMQLVNIQHREEQVHARLVAHELEIAHRIQRALLPRTLPQLAGFRLAGNWESARQVGGDFYDAFSLDDHSLLLAVGDVMGKGVPAALFATITRSLLRALSIRAHHPRHLLERLNALLYEELSRVGMFVTVQLVFVDLHRRQLVVASAGHCPVLMFSEGSVRTLGITGIPLGIFPEASYQQQTASFGQPGGLLIYTDGLTETVNPNGEMFGPERLAEWLKIRLPLPGTAESLRDELAAELVRFRAGTPLRDDQAFLLLAEDPVSIPSHAPTPFVTSMVAPGTTISSLPSAVSATASVQSIS